MSHKGEITLKRLGVPHKWVSSTRHSVMYTCNLDKLPDCWKHKEQVKDCISFAVLHYAIPPATLGEGEKRSWTHRRKTTTSHFPLI